MFYQHKDERLKVITKNTTSLQEGLRGAIG